MSFKSVPLSGPDTEVFLTSEPETYGTVDQTGAHSLLYGGNISSVSDNAVGQTNLSFTNAYDAVDWGHSGMAGPSSPSSTSTSFILNHATSSATLLCYKGENGGSGYGDTTHFGFSFFGDLA